MPYNINDLGDRFTSKVVVGDDGCWTWTAANNGCGYGVLKVLGTRRNAYAHRTAYETLVGPIPDGLDLDHLCRNRACINPDHLEPVTRRENLNRSPHMGPGWGAGARKARAA